jgi:hypothetical protein
VVLDTALQPVCEDKRLRADELFKLLKETPVPAIAVAWKKAWEKARQRYIDRPCARTYQEFIDRLHNRPSEQGEHS